MPGVVTFGVPDEALSFNRFSPVDSRPVGLMKVATCNWPTVVLVVLFLGCALFFSGYEQAGSSLNLFAERYTDRSMEWLHFVIPASGAGTPPATKAYCSPSATSTLASPLISVRTSTCVVGKRSYAMTVAPPFRDVRSRDNLKRTKR